MCSVVKAIAQLKKIDPRTLQIHTHKHTHKHTHIHISFQEPTWKQKRTNLCKREDTSSSPIKTLFCSFLFSIVFFEFLASFFRTPLQFPPKFLKDFRRKRKKKNPNCVFLSKGRRRKTDRWRAWTPRTLRNGGTNSRRERETKSKWIFEFFFSKHPNLHLFWANNISNEKKEEMFLQIFVNNENA